MRLSHISRFQASSPSRIARIWRSTVASRPSSGPTGAGRATSPMPSPGSLASRAPRACVATDGGRHLQRQRCAQAHRGRRGAAEAERRPVAAGQRRGAAGCLGHRARMARRGRAAESRCTVEVTRRLYRSGESEYLIDGQTCRLRDVHELLMDTGLGAKAYAIIEQGKIGMILSSRPTDRRQLIEEAAGITKYKARRRAAELKLEAAQQNLTRLEDIIFEIEKQFGSLKRQAAKARRYKRLRDELRRWEKVLFAGRYRESRAQDRIGARPPGRRAPAESAASAAPGAAEADFSRVRIELAEAETAATHAREAVHAQRARHQSPAAADRARSPADRGARRRGPKRFAASSQMLEARREPGRIALARAAAGGRERRSGIEQRAAASWSGSSRIRAGITAIEGLEADVEAARAEVFAALNVATTLRHAIRARGRSAGSASSRSSRSWISKSPSSRRKRERRRRARGDAEALRRAREASKRRSSRTTRASPSWRAARIEHEWRSPGLTAREQELAGVARAAGSLDGTRKGQRRLHRRGAHGARPGQRPVGQMGALADFSRSSRSTSARSRRASAISCSTCSFDATSRRRRGLTLVRQEDAGRCGFCGRSDGGRATTVSAGQAGVARDVHVPPAGCLPRSVVRISGPFRGGDSRRDGRGADRRDRPRRSRSRRHDAIPCSPRSTATSCAGARRCPAAARTKARGILATQTRDQGAARASGRHREPSAIARCARDRRLSRRRSRRRRTRGRGAERGAHRQEKAIVGARAAGRSARRTTAERSQRRPTCSDRNAARRGGARGRSMRARPKRANRSRG